MATIERILSFTAKEKKVPPVELEHGTLLEGIGLAGDSRAKGGERQITILALETKAWMETSPQGLCFKRFQGNLEIKGLDLSNLKTGDVLCIGQAEIQITQVGKPCYPEDCKLAAAGAPCLLRETAMFAKVIQSGEIKIKDEITKKLHCHFGRAAKEKPNQ